MIGDDNGYEFGTYVVLLPEKLVVNDFFFGYLFLMESNKEEIILIYDNSIYKHVHLMMKVKHNYLMEQLHTFFNTFEEWF